MREHLKELWAYRQLIPMFVERDIRARYKQTFIGFSWAIIQPFFLMIIFNVIFSKFLNVSSEGIPYPIFSYSVLVPWTFFQRSVTTSSESLPLQSNIVTKIYFPREIVPFSTIFSALIDFFIAFALFILMLVFYKIPITAYILLFPVLLIIQVAFAASLSLFFSGLSVIIRDLRYALPLFIQIWMYSSPVIYGISGLQPVYRKLLYLNPVTGILQGYRDIFLFQRFPMFDYLGISLLFTLFFLIFSYSFFKKIESVFIDLL